MDGNPVRGLSGFEGLGTAAALEAIADERRRAVVRALAAADGPVTLRELASELVAMPGGPTRDLDTAIVDLHHRTLPKLDALDLIDYDPDAATVEIRAPAAELLPLVDYVEFTDGGR